MGKTQREEISGDGEGRKAPKLETSGERTLIVVTHLHLFGMKINTNPNPNPTEDSKFIWIKPLPNFSMGLAEFDSRKILVGGEKLLDGCHIPLMYTDLKFDDLISSEIYELKKVGNDAIEIAPSDSIPRFNEGKGMPIVEMLGGKIYVLHTGSLFKTSYFCGSDYSPSVFEVFDPSSTSKNWEVKLKTPFHDILKEIERYAVDNYCRIGDKLYFQVAADCSTSCHSFDLKTEQWSKDDYYFPSLSGLDIAFSGISVSVPGLDGHVILSCGQAYFQEWPIFSASLFIEGKGVLYYQIVNTIFSFGAFTGFGNVSCKFLELGNGEFCGILTGTEQEYDPEGGPLEKEEGGRPKNYLLISIFTLQAITPPPSSPSSSKPEERVFLRVHVKNQERFTIGGYDWAHVVDATFLENCCSL